MTRSTSSWRVLATDAPMKLPSPVQSLTICTNLSIEASARGLSPSSLARVSPAQSEMLARTAAPWMTSRVVLPMPRVGVLMTRSSETVSSGFATTRR